jgi:hypothetical protein
MNEEEIKLKYVLPWLTEAGIRAEELQFERSFNLKIGKNTVIVGATNRKRTSSVAGRLDILVRRNEENLLIVEVKAEHLSLSDDDRDQAISYARLVHPMAPYALITNGRDFRLYDCLSKNRIEPETIKVRGFTATFPADAIEEAQELFLRSSKANLLAFCQAQVSNELAPLKGNLSQLERKYVPELHLVREVVSKSINDFLTSPQPGLMLVGHSGSGKTCNTCWAVEELLKNDFPVLFFNGLFLERDIVHAIASEFSWAFGSLDNEVTILRRLVRSIGEQPLIVVVDAVDEWTYGPRAQHLNTLISAAKAEKIKLILSCKSSVFKEFAEVRGVASHVGRLSNVVPIAPFSNKEFFRVIEKYRRAYNFRGRFESVVLQQARTNPFLLRVLFDVAHKSNAKDLTFTSVQFFENYYQRSIEKTDNAQEADFTLKAIAGELYKKDADWILEDELRARLGLKINEHIMADLFHYGILTKGDKNGVSTIGFYFQQLRDYIISFKASRFQHLSDEAFKAALSGVAFPSMQGDVVTFYYRLAALNHRQTLDGHLRTNAQSYLQLYLSIIEDE